MKNTKHFLYWTLIAVLIFSSCKKDPIQTNDVPITETNALSLVKNNNGILKFKNQEHFYQCFNLISSMSKNEILSWQKGIGFISLMGRLNNFEVELMKIMKQYPMEEESMEDYNAYKKAIVPLAKKYADFLSIDENGNITKQDILESAMAWFSNSQKEFIIDKDLVYSDYDQAVRVKNGTHAQVLQILDSKSSNEAAGLYYYPIQRKGLQSTSNKRFEQEYSKGVTMINEMAGENRDWRRKKHRRRTSFYFEIIINPISVSQFPYLVKAEHHFNYYGYNQKRHWLGFWQPTWCTVDVSGTYYTAPTGNILPHINCYQPDPQNILTGYIPYTYSHSQWASNFSHNTPVITPINSSNSGAGPWAADFTANFTLNSTHNNPTGTQVITLSF